MGYEVLDDSVYDKGDKKKGKSKNNSSNMKAFWIHLGIIIFFLFLLFFFFVSDVTFNFNDEKEKILTLTGELDNFDKEYNGEIKINSAHFILKTPGASFEETSQDISIKDFKGEIKLENNSLNFNGIASKISFGKNTLDLNGKEFTLKSQKRTNTNLYFENLELNFKSGTLEYANSVNFDFEKATLTLTKFNTSMNYDGKFVFSGKPESFSFNYPEDNLTLVYNG